MPATLASGSPGRSREAEHCLDVIILRLGMRPRDGIDLERAMRHGRGMRSASGLAGDHRKASLGLKFRVMSLKASYVPGGRCRGEDKSTALRALMATER